MKQYIGISRDHSASMRSILSGAIKDYNENITAIKTAATQHDIDTVVSVVECGTGTSDRVGRVIVNSNVQALKPLDKYIASGSGTPLWDSVGELITLLSSVPDASNPEVSFLVMIITDGQENRSKIWNSRTISDKIRQLQYTDKWTFVFRVPRGEKNTLVRLGIPEGNIQEWDQTSKGYEIATAATTAAVGNFYKSRSAGVTSTGKFYADIGNVSPVQVSRELRNISDRIYVLPVDIVRDGMAIKNYAEIWGFRYNLGDWFYQLTKTETVQQSKMIVVKSKDSGAYYAGENARNLLGLPNYGDVKLHPGNMGRYEVYIQSTSVNRKLVGGTNLLRIEDRRGI
jgi:hypothetical protein